MKFKLPILLLSIFIFSHGKAQNLFDEKTQFLDLKVSFGSPFWGSVSNRLPIVPHINYEKAVSKSISIGGSGAYSSARQNYFGYELRYTALYLGGRGSYHFLTKEKLDPYAGLSLGYIIVSVNDKTYSASYGSEVGLGAFAGIRYKLANKIALNAELGYSGLSILTVGASFKL